MRVQDDLQTLIYYAVAIEKKFRADELADGVGCSPATIYDFMEGRRSVPASYVPRLFNATRDIRFLDVLLKPCGMTAAPIPAAGERASRESLVGHVARAVVEVGHVSAAILESAADGRIDRREAKRIREEIHEAQTMLSTLEAALPKHDGPAPVPFDPRERSATR